MLLLLATATMLVVSAVLPSAPAAHAQGMAQLSSGGSLGVLLEPEWSEGGQAKFKVTFQKPGTQTTQEHIDYDLIIKDSSGAQVFKATQLLNQPVLHTASGTVTIPYTFKQNGSYTVEVDMFGILFNPITPENAKFSVNVTPEFPAAGALPVAAAAVMAAGMALKRKLLRLF
jgi:hypothetical protein